jgi:hydroxymethylpyrimidine/phosphomethylpyrimidine kinase
LKKPSRLKITCLSIAGFDPTGGAGVIADLLTFSRIKVWGTAAVAVITGQNNARVYRAEPVSPKLLRSQIESVLEDFPIQAVKIGALGSRANLREVSRLLKESGLRRVVVDPILRARDGTRLMEEGGSRDYLNFLFPLATVITPNLPEASEFTGIKVRSRKEMEKAAAVLSGSGAGSVLVKGGHLERGAPRDLFLEKGEFFWIPGSRRVPARIHGTGCLLSSAVAAFLARGRTPLDSVLAAKAMISRAIIKSEKCPRWSYRIMARK